MVVAKVLFLVNILQVGWCRFNDHHPLGIINGHPVVIENAPYMASLRLNGSYHWCGASIIHEQFVLTAAHCIIPNRKFKVLVGSTVATDNIKGEGELYDIEEIKIHEHFSETSYDYDVCLLKLKKRLSFGPKVGKIVLATEKVSFKNGMKMNVTGWGSDGVQPISPKLLQVEIPFVARKRCRKAYFLKKEITPHMICAGGKGGDSCQGDSGGPLTIGNVQVGITSFGYGCGEIPGVYAKVSSALPWIMEKLHLYQ